jgi:hypothetical protein
LASSPSPAPNILPLVNKKATLHINIFSVLLSICVRL